MKLFRWILAIIALGLLGYGFHVAMSVPADEAMFNVQRIFYYHIPAWIMTSLCFGANLIGSVVYLAARNKRPTLALRADAVAVSTAEMGVIFCLVGLVTGSLWARYAWGIWWTWDERLTSTLILWLIYVSYLLSGTSPPARRCVPSPPCSPSSATSTYRSSICPLVGGALSIPGRCFSAPRAPE